MNARTGMTVKIVTGRLGIRPEPTLSVGLVEGSWGIFALVSLRRRSDDGTEVGVEVCVLRHVLRVEYTRQDTVTASSASGLGSF
jgi:hypothetical protein